MLYPKMLCTSFYLKSGPILKKALARCTSSLPIKVIDPSNLTDEEKRYIDAANKIKAMKVSPERDVINFPHPIREIYPEKESADYYTSLKSDSVTSLENAIEVEKVEQWRAAGQKYLFDAKRENIGLQLEANYRQNLLHTYNEVKRRLDYQVELAQTKKRLEHEHLVKWVLNKVKLAITPEEERKTLHRCIEDLKALSAQNVHA